MRMKSNSTFRRFLMNLAITAACVVRPVKAWGADYKDLVGSTLQGWTLSWGSYNVQNGNYYFTAEDAKTAYNKAGYNHTKAWNSVYDKLSGSILGENITSNSNGVSYAKYAPDVDYISAGKWWGYYPIVKEVTDNSYRFYVNNKTSGDVNYDVLFSNTANNPCSSSLTLPTIPDGYNTSFRIGSCQPPNMVSEREFSTCEFQ